MGERRYRYVGPPELQDAVRPGDGGFRIRSAGDFAAWAAQRPTAELAEPFTFVVDTEGVLRLAPRRSEHVACAGGEEVLAAGEISFAHAAGRWTVDQVTNHSTGYCPDTTSWPAVTRALHHAGLPHPDGFTHELVFRRCPTCHERNIVRDSDFTCAFCDTALPRTWNVDPSAGRSDRT